MSGHTEFICGRRTDKQTHKDMATRQWKTRPCNPPPHGKAPRRESTVGKGPNSQIHYFFYFSSEFPLMLPLTTFSDPLRPLRICPGCLSRSMSVLSGIDFDEEFVFPARPNATEIQFADNVPNSSTASTANSFRRSNSVESEASSGFGGSNGFAKHDSEETTCQHQDLLELLEKLHAEIALKDCRLRDVEDYMDKLIARVMEHNPELLAAPIQENTPSNHEKSFGSSTSDDSCF